MPVEDSDSSSSSDAEQPDVNVSVNPITPPYEGPVDDQETPAEDRVGCKALYVMISVSFFVLLLKENLFYIYLVGTVLTLSIPTFLVLIVMQ